MRRRRGRLAPAFPGAIERAYSATLKRRQRGVHDAVMREVDGILGVVGEGIDGRARLERVMRTDADPDAGTLLKVVDLARGIFGRSDPNAEYIKGIGRQVDLFATQQNASALGVPAVGIQAPTSLLDAWLAANVALIKSIDARYFDDVERLIRDAFIDGANTREVRAAVSRAFEISKGRAEVIARDQIAKLNGQITKHRQTELGVVEYDWDTSGDERVRAAHVRLDGKRMRWDTPDPGEGHPGSAVMCRCVAIPVIPEV